MKKTADPCSLADLLDETRWECSLTRDRRVLLSPVGTVFSNLPWEVQPQYLGPAPIVTTSDRDRDFTDGSIPDS
jgi:hypothetical protein